VQVTGEEVFDTIELVYANELNTSLATDEQYEFRPIDDTVILKASDAIVVPLSRTFTFGDTNTKKQVVLASPESFMNSDTEFVTANASVSNPTGAITGGITDLGSLGFVQYETSNTDLQQGFLLRASVRRATSGTGFLEVSVGAVSGGSNYSFIQYRFRDVEDDFDEDAFTVLEFAGLPASNVLTDANNNDFTEYHTILSSVLFFGNNSEIKDVEILVPDVDAGGTASEQFASGFVRDVQQDVAEVKVVGELGTVADRMNWTPTNESEVTVPVERIQYTLTPRDGLVTTYELGQAYDAEALSQRKVLKDLAREAVSE